jgi:hypothetical protein
MARAETAAARAAPKQTPKPASRQAPRTQTPSGPRTTERRRNGCTISASTCAKERLIYKKIN